MGHEPSLPRGEQETGLPLDPAMLGRLMPMHLILSGDGVIRAAGPLIRRMFPGTEIRGRSLFSLFALRGPSQITSVAGLIARDGQKFRMVPQGGGLRLRGVAVPLARDAGVLVNLTFGIDIMRAVDQLDLTDTDFAATDMTMELLYLAEANALVMGEMRALSRRLDGARRQAEDEALTDPLTGLRNRRACDAFLAGLCREGTAFALLHLDLDFFKQVNDRLGHAAGDQVLTAVAAVLRGQTRARDCVARVGGDEFIAILPELTNETRLRALAQEVVGQISRPVPWRDTLCRVSVSIGVVAVPPGLYPDPAQVLADADAALYAAKGAGRGRVAWAQDLRPGGTGQGSGGNAGEADLRAAEARE